MSNETQNVDVLAVMLRLINMASTHQHGKPRLEKDAYVARAAVAELIDVQRRLVAWNGNVNGTGTELADICFAAEDALTRIGGAA